MFQGKNKNANDHIKKYVGSQQATVVANNTVFTGDIEFQGAVIIQGKVRGTIKSLEGAVSIAASGSVDGEIQVPFVEIYGSVQGNIIASESVVLGTTANVQGNLQYGLLTIEQGAIIEGETRKLSSSGHIGNIIDSSANKDIKGIDASKKKDKEPV
jgi:cytoskeletal protein CcmA (bactofilin family)